MRWNARICRVAPREMITFSSRDVVEESRRKRNIVPKTRKCLHGCREMDVPVFPTVSGALPPRRDADGFHNDFMIDLRDPFLHMSRTIESDMKGIEQQMEQAMERLQSSSLDDQTYGKKYTREWRDENAHSKTYFSESVTIMRPGNRLVRGSRGQNHGLATMGIVLAGVAVASWYHGTKRLLHVYKHTTFSEEYRWKLVLMWPLLLMTSPKFKEEWENATIRSKKETLVEPSRNNTTS